MIPTQSLYNGLKIPSLLLGTFQLDKQLVDSVIKYAISVGYTGFDLSSHYGNEKYIGDILNTYINEKSSLFISTKVEWEDYVNYNKNRTLRNVDVSLKALQTDSVDLLLMHWPYSENFIDIWKAMEDFYRKSKAKSIGVSNFRERHLDKLISACDIKPMVNQIEIHPLYSNKPLIKYCKERDILVEAYCPLGLMDKRLMSSIVLENLAKKFSKTIPQIILRWEIQQGLVPCPKSATPKRLLENISVFDFVLTEDDMCAIDSLNENYKFYIESIYCTGY
jgi:diketogulonate reductase-like aldo/keto reductase